MSVFVLDRKGKPLMPCREARARQLLDAKKAMVHKVYPFTIRLKERIGGDVQPTYLKFDPGSKFTGVAVTRESAEGTHALWGAELHHRGQQIQKALEKRSNYRRRRRSANLRYRAPRFNNRRKPVGWLAPSLMHRVDNISSWTRKLSRLCPISGISVETVKFDMQKMVNPEISGVEYQQGTLEGYEVREYLLEKFARKCCYCEAVDVPLNIEHVHAKARGGSNRVSNLAMSCVPCNEKKGARDIRDFLAKKPEILARVLAQLQRPLKDAAAVNATRKKVQSDLAQLGLPLQVGTGGQTKWNRSRLSVPKSHVNDALCVGPVKALFGWQGLKVLVIKCVGRGDYCRTDTDKYGFVRVSKNGKPSYKSRKKQQGLYRTGDLVRAKTPQGSIIGHLNARTDGTAYIPQGKSQRNIPKKKKILQCILLQPSDGYRYSFRLPPSEGAEAK